MYGIDCSIKISAASAIALKNAGVKAIGRYIVGNYGLTQDELKAKVISRNISLINQKLMSTILQFPMSGW
ncbi:hypothetical protein Desaci_3045 [Desulfosporosinus acidiphilus SJ4]|uniref:Uncharacterized protein n=1 Tax=Desulfosporosinus acidiphilus (strain DSM 22704 / JCM 16185 / SJ4) TaxID=646529 RepID=I4D829_DESAJ|nr:hypothetical protein [Desulfosporosinus acidiphilus]AFM41953.1 hypothetical protein Desaci_3045 [Desulfosporosinus acidiphilus SJ4]